MFLCARTDRIHVGAGPKQVNWNHGTRLGVTLHGLAQQIRIDVVRLLVNVHENRNGAHARNSAGRRKESIWRGDDFIARTDFESQQGQQQRVRTRGATDRVSSPAISSDFALEAGDLLAQDKLLRVDDPQNLRQNLCANLPVLGFQLEEWHLTFSSNVHDLFGVQETGRTISSLLRYSAPQAVHLAWVSSSRPANSIVPHSPT